MTFLSTIFQTLTRLLGRMHFGLWSRICRFVSRATSDAATQLIRSYESDALRLNAEIARLSSLVKLQELETEKLTEIIARDRERVKAESAIAARSISESNNRPTQLYGE